MAGLPLRSSRSVAQVPRLRSSRRDQRRNRVQRQCAARPRESSAKADSCPTPRCASRARTDGSDRCRSRLATARPFSTAIERFLRLLCARSTRRTLVQRPRTTASHLRAGAVRRAPLCIQGGWNVIVRMAAPRPPRSATTASLTRRAGRHTLQVTRAFASRAQEVIDDARCPARSVRLRGVRFHLHRTVGDRAELRPAACIRASVRTVRCGFPPLRRRSTISRGSDHAKVWIAEHHQQTPGKAGCQT